MDPLHVTVLGRHNNTNRNGIGGQEVFNSFSVNAQKNILLCALVRRKVTTDYNYAHHLQYCCYVFRILSTRDGGSSVCMYTMVTIIKYDIVCAVGLQSIVM